MNEKLLSVSDTKEFEIEIFGSGKLEVKTAKEDLITAINASANGMPEESTSLDLARRLFEFLMEKNIDPIDHAIKSLKAEISKTY